jgi:hypothetical protein
MPLSLSNLDSQIASIKTGGFQKVLQTDTGFMRRWKVTLRSKRGNPKASISSLIAGRNTVVVYTKHQQLHEHEFATHRLSPAPIRLSPGAAASLVTTVRTDLVSVCVAVVFDSYLKVEKASQMFSQGA